MNDEKAIKPNRPRLPSSGASSGPVKWIVLISSVLLLSAAVWRLASRVSGEPSELQDAFDRTTLYYLLAAVALVLLDRLDTFKVGDLELKFRELEQKTDAIAEEAAEARDIGVRAEQLAIGTGGIVPGTRGSLATGAVTSPTPAVFPRPATNAEDKQKGRFGGLAERDGLRLSARVNPLDGSDDWFEVKLRVLAMPGVAPLSGAVRFFLHQTFRRDEVVTATNAKGTAELDIVAFGAFTVGVLAGSERVPLELDLADPALVPKAPRRFREG